MHVRMPSRIEVAFLALAGVFLVELFAPSHSRVEIRELCHLCGNRREIIQRVRWWHEQPAKERALTESPIAEGHVHDWWRYQEQYSDWNSHHNKYGRRSVLRAAETHPAADSP